MQDKADDASAIGDDLLDITNETPSDRLGTDNNILLLGTYNIDQTAAEHIFDGSITQASGADIWDGFVNYGNEGINIQILQDGAYEANDFWNQTPDGEALSGLNRDVTNGISHRFMLKVRTSGTDIDGRRVIGMSREYGKTFKEFKVNGTSRGNNTLALANATDLNNATVSGTVATWTTITNTEGYRSIDVDINSVDENYYSEWNTDIYSNPDLYERIKYLTRYDSVETIYGIDAKIFRGITHEIDVDTPTGIFNAVEAVSWTGGTGQMLAIDSTTAGTKMWIQLLTGLIPSDGDTITGGTSGGTVDVNVTVLERPVSPEVVGASTGSAIIGAYGFGVEATDLTAADKVFDLTNAQVTPPDYRTTSVTGVESGESRVLVAPDNGGLMIDQFTLDTTVIADAGTVILTDGVEDLGTSTQSATDTPAAGQFRLFDDNGVSHIVSYTSFTVQANTMTFLGCTGTPAATATNNAFISYVDELAGSTVSAFTTVYHSPRTLYVRVRDGGTVNGTPVKTFQTTLALGSATSAILTPDS